MGFTLLEVGVTNFNWSHLLKALFLEAIDKWVNDKSSGQMGVLPLQLLVKVLPVYSK